MPIVDLDDGTYGRFEFAARLFDVPIREAVKRLADKLVEQDPDADTTSSHEAVLHPPTQANDVEVHAVYRGHRISGVFEPDTRCLEITSGRLAGQRFTSPSRAAIAVVEEFNPDRRHANTNGRTFWLMTGSGKTLHYILGRRGAGDDHR
jgi:hypothetical protein